MNDLQLAITVLNETTRQCEPDNPLSERLGLYAGACELLRQMEEHVRRHCHGDGYALEKIGNAKWHIGAALGVDIDNGHPPDQHRAWSLGALGTLQSHLQSFEEE